AAATRSSSVAGELLAAATKHRDEVGNLLARARARAAASAELTMLAEQDEELARIAAEVAAARRAAPVLPHLAAAADGAVHVDRTAAQEQQARIRLAELAPELAEAEPAALLAAHDAAQQRVGGLEALRPLAEEITQLRQAAADAGSASGTAKAALAENEAARTTLPTRVLDARAVVDTARTAAAQVEGMQLRAQSLTRALATAGTRDELDATRATLHEQVVAAREHAQEARQLYQDLQQRQLDGAAARLASLLAPGEPCPVCGGVEHPVPAEPLVDAVSTEQVERAETAYQAAGAALQELERQLSAADARRIEQAGQLTDFGGAEVATTVLREQLTEAKSAALQAIERADGLQMAEDALAELERERGELDTRRARLEAELTSLTDRTAETSAAVARAEARLAKHLDGAADLDAAIMAAQQRAQAIADARGAARAAIEAVDTRVRLDQDAHAAATAAGFLGVAQVQAAVRDPSWIEQQEAARRAHDAAVTAARTRLIDSGEDPLDATALADAVAAATGAVEESARAHRAAVAAQGARAQQAGDLQRLVPRYCAAWTRLQPQRQACEQLKALADLTAGDGANHRRMALSSYVLAARLEQVAAAASVRLLRMTDGRYALLHSDDAVGAQRRRGLALRVSDSWTGQDRDTASLSGGETFLASLALALGLADVVTAEAGGARIETLFVDEGFGTLDEDTLDEVLGVLDGLREGGRMVGVVSHVAELRQRVPTRIEVRKTRSGSTIHQPQPATV
ncbi:MAG TPA: SbcC/MukB-like Walker B domain-containing protein, partial [Mycobacteriales bacterium]|nr:SbcC/MukB-like Walker B domain-containing protein [Mycobacteriales bacterium]